MHIEAIISTHPLRKAVELLIHKVYARQYGAFVTVFPEMMFAAFDDNDIPVCAAGIRTEDTGFFSQCYLGEPVEKILSSHAGLKVTASSIIEVTTLAATKPWVSLKLIDHIIAYGRDIGKGWGLFTGTALLKKRLDYTGQTLLDLGLAMATAVPNSTIWGGYYDTSPRVFAFAYQGKMSRQKDIMPSQNATLSMGIENANHPIYMTENMQGSLHA